jgi:hypothetical protein
MIECSPSDHKTVNEQKQGLNKIAFYSKIKDIRVEKIKEEV